MCATNSDFKKIDIFEIFQANQIQTIANNSFTKITEGKMLTRGRKTDETELLINITYRSKQTIIVY